MLNVEGVLPFPSNKDDYGYALLTLVLCAIQRFCHLNNHDGVGELLICINCNRKAPKSCTEHLLLQKPCELYLAIFHGQFRQLREESLGASTPQEQMQAILCILCETRLRWQMSVDWAIRHLGNQKRDEMACEGG